MHYIVWAFYLNISCIIHDLGTLRVSWKIQVMGLIASRWFVHNRFINLGNPFEIVVHHLLIEGMIVVGHWDRILRVSVLVYTITH